MFHTHCTCISIFFFSQTKVTEPLLLNQLSGIMDPKIQAEIERQQSNMLEKLSTSNLDDDGDKNVTNLHI